MQGMKATKRSIKMLDFYNLSDDKKLFMTLQKGIKLRVWVYYIQLKRKSPSLSLHKMVSDHK